MCGQRQSSYTPNSTAARRNWRRQAHLSCRLDSQCSDDRDEEEEDVKYLTLDACVCRNNSSCLPNFFTVLLVSVSVSTGLLSTFCSIYKVPQQISVFFLHTLHRFLPSWAHKSLCTSWMPRYDLTAWLGVQYQLLTYILSLGFYSLCFFLQTTSCRTVPDGSIGSGVIGFPVG